MGIQIHGCWFFLHYCSLLLPGLRCCSPPLSPGADLAMSDKGWWGGEAVWAVRAGDWLVAKVLVAHVRQQRGLEGEALAALLALEGCLARVNWAVAHQVTVLYEAFSTLGTPATTASHWTWCWHGLQLTERHGGRNLTQLWQQHHTERDTDKYMVCSSLNSTVVVPLVPYTLDTPGTTASHRAWHWHDMTLTLISAVVHQWFSKKPPHFTPATPHRAWHRLHLNERWWYTWHICNNSIMQSMKWFAAHWWHTRLWFSKNLHTPATASRGAWWGLHLTVLYELFFTLHTPATASRRAWQSLQLHYS